jgi:hypothetical protein
MSQAVAARVFEGEILTDREHPRTGAGQAGANDAKPGAHERHRGFDVGGTINRALRAAGLIKD